MEYRGRRPRRSHKRRVKSAKARNINVGIRGYGTLNVGRRGYGTFEYRCRLDTKPIQRVRYKVYPTMFAEEGILVRTRTYGGGGNESPKGLTLEDIDKICSETYDYDEKRIVVIVMARFTLPEVKKMIYRHLEAWHYFTEQSLDLFWLGYIADKTPSISYEDEHPLKHIRFDYRSFTADLNRLSKITKYSPDDVVSLYLCDYHDGHIHLEDSIYIDIENLAQQEIDTKLKRFFHYLITVCKKNHCVKDVRLKLTRKLLQSNIDGLTCMDLLENVANIAGPAATLLTGALKVT